MKIFTTITAGSFLNPLRLQQALPGRFAARLLMMIVLSLGVGKSWGQTTIASQDFEAVPATPTITYTTTDIGTPGASTGISSGQTGASGSNAPSAVNMFTGGSQGYRLQGPASGSANTGRILTFSAVNTTGYTNIQASFRVAGMSLGSNANGMDGATGTTILGASTPLDFALIEVSPDGGTTWYQQGVVKIDLAATSNVRWSFGATGSGTKVYAANNSYSNFPTTGTGTITSGTTAVTTATITSLPSVSNLQIRITLQCNSANESWIIDDVIISGTVASTPVISIADNGTQPAAGNITPSSTKNILQTFTIANDATAIATLNTVTVPLTGTYLPADITTLGIKLYSNSTNNIATATAIKSVTPTASGTGETITFGSLAQSLAVNSTTYYWVTADISAGPTNGRTIAASSALTSANFVFASANQTTAVSAGGLQTITVVTPSITLSSPSQITAANVAQGATGQLLSNFQAAVTTANATINSIAVVTGGTYATSSFVSNYKLFYNPTSNTFGGATQIGTTQGSVASGGTVSFGSLSTTISSGSTGYFWVIADISLGATIGQTVNIAANPTLSFASGTPTGSITAGGDQTFVSCTPTDVSSPSASSANASSVLTWTNPNCFDEILIVAATASNTGTPTGDGSAYTGSLTYGSGTSLGNGFVVYKGASSSQTVINLTNGTPYFFKFFTRRGITWTSGTEVSATPNIAGYYWNGANITANPAAGGTGTWGTALSWRQPSATGAQATWADGNNAVFAGTAGNVTLDANRNATGFYFNTPGYNLVTTSATTVALTGPIILGNNVGLTFAPNINVVTPVSGTISVGSISGSGTANVTISSAQGSGTTIAQRINLAAANTTVSVPVNIISAGGSGTGTVAGFVATNTGTSLTSAATITNNSAIKTIVGATSGNDITINGVISGTADLQFSGGPTGGAGTVTLNAVNNYTGATLFNASNSGVIRLGISNALPASTDVTMANSAGNGGIFDLNGFNQTLGSLTSGAGGGSIRNNGAVDATLTVSGAASPAAFALPITDGITNKTILVKSGSGTLTLSGTNTYTGGTSVTGGTLTLGASNVLADAGAVIVNGGTLNSGGAFTETIGALTLTSGSITGATGTLTPASIAASAGTIDVILAGTTALNKSGAGTVFLTNGSNSYSGGTTINGGVLSVNGANRLGAVGGNLNINAGTFQLTTVSVTSGRNIVLGSANSTIDVAAGITYTATTGVLSGTGDLNKTGAGTLSLQTVNTYSGATTVSAGTLQLGNANVLPANTVFTLNGGALRTGATTGFNQTLGTLNLNASSSIALGTGVHTLTFANSSAISWAGTTLSITGWTGAAGAAGTAGKIVIGVGGLTTAQLAKINFAGFPNGAMILGSGEIVPLLNTYYPRTTATDLSLLTDWTDDVNGLSGASPADFTSASQVFNISRNGILLNPWTVSGGSNVILTATFLEFGPSARLSVGSGSTVNFNGQAVTLRSTAAGTASIGTISGTLTGATNVTVERYIKLRAGGDGRAYRLLTPTVNTTGNIQANWMEGGMNTAIGTNVDPVPGYGTQISGSGGNTNGFDKTASNAASLYNVTNGVTPTYTAVGSVSSGTMNAKTGYFLYLRGDRNQDMTLPLASNMPTSATTLRATGTLVQGTQTTFTNAFTGGGALNLVTNPYASPIDWSLVQPAASGITSSYTYWDANIGSRGGFATVTTAGVSTPTTSATQIIQPGQAFFVESDGSVPTVSIQEAHKVAGNNNDVFIVAPAPIESFRTELYYTEANGYRRIADGAIALYGNGYSAAVDAQDSREINNWDENIAIARDGKHLAIESRPVIGKADDLPLFMNNMKQRKYEFEFTPTVFSNTALKAELVDNFLGTRTLLSVTQPTTVSFAVTADPASAATDRFKVVFGAFGNPQGVDAITIKAAQQNNGVQVNWSSKTETDMESYEVERSTYGTAFTKINTTAARGNSISTVNYSWFDASPNMGTAFYRIKGTDKAGNIRYSDMVRVLFGKGEPAIVAYPNPVQGNTFTIDMYNLAKGTYSISLYDNSGQLVYTGQLQHDGSQATRTITLNRDIAKGAYQLQLTGGNGFKTTQRIIKN